MNRTFIFRALFVFGFLAPAVVAAPAFVQAATQKIAAVVNDEAISVSDLNNRLRLIMASSGLPNTEDVRAKLTPQVLSSLIDEKLMQQEAQKLKLAVDKTDVDNGFATLAQQNNKTPAAFKAMLRSAGIDLSTLEDQIRAQVAWGKVIKAKLRPKVIVSDRDVDAVLERLKRASGSTEYLVAEIFLPFSDSNEESKARQLANHLVSELRAGKTSFFKLAQQFSKSAGASNGGDMGWLPESQIDPDILKTLEKTAKEQVTNPVHTPEGFHILLLRDKRSMSGETLPSRDQINYNLGMQRLDKLQRRHLMDIKAASFIEIRV